MSSSSLADVGSVISSTPTMGVASRDVTTGKRSHTDSSTPEGFAKAISMVSVARGEADAARAVPRMRDSKDTETALAAVAAASVFLPSPHVEEALPSERARQLEQSARRLRENAERLRAENRRCRLLGGPGPPLGASAGGAELDVAAVPEPGDAGPGIATDGGHTQLPADKAQRFEEMRRRIADLDVLNALERDRVEAEQRLTEERRRAQEKFERDLQERTLREEQERFEREAREAEACSLRKEEARRELEERARRRREQHSHDLERSKQLEEQRKEGRSEDAQLRLQAFEEELERAWANQEAANRQRLDHYARERQRQYEAWDRDLRSDRQRFASEAEFCEAARRSQATRAARADDEFYRRGAAGGGVAASSGSTPRPPQGAPPPGAPPAGARVRAAEVGVAAAAMKTLCADELAVLKDLQSVRGATREIQKSKVKDLLFRWHPDKNPACAEKATRIFQFVQKQREAILGL